MRRLLIPRSFFGLIARIVMLNAVLGLITYALNLAMLGARLVVMLQVIQFHRLTDALHAILPMR